MKTERRIATIRLFRLLMPLSFLAKPKRLAKLHWPMNPGEKRQDAFTTSRIQRNTLAVCTSHSTSCNVYLCALSLSYDPPLWWKIHTQAVPPKPLSELQIILFVQLCLPSWSSVSNSLRPCCIKCKCSIIFILNWSQGSNLLKYASTLVG